MKDRALLFGKKEFRRITGDANQRPWDGRGDAITGNKPRNNIVGFERRLGRRLAGEQISMRRDLPERKSGTGFFEGYGGDRCENKN